MRQPGTWVRPRLWLRRAPEPGTAPSVLRLRRATDYISHNAPRSGLGLAKRLKPGLRHQRPVKAVFLRRWPVKGRTGEIGSSAVAMSVSSRGGSPTKLHPQPRHGWTFIAPQGSGRGQ